MVNARSGRRGKPSTHEKEYLIVTTYTFPEHPYKRWAEDYLDRIEDLYGMPGFSEPLEDLLDKVPTKSVEYHELSSALHKG